MRGANIADGLRSATDAPRQQTPEWPAHTPESKGKRVFVFNKRSGFVELRGEKKTVIDGDVVIEPTVKVRYSDYIAILDPTKDVELIELLERSEFFQRKAVDADGRGHFVGGGFIRIRDRRDVMEEEARERVERHLAEHAAVMQDPRLAAVLRQLAGKQGFGMAPDGEAVKVSTTDPKTS